MIENSVKSVSGEQHIACDLALKIARSDAEKVYRDLSGYRIIIVLEPDGWHVDYALKDPRSKGGRPHYVISSMSGEILFKRYEQ
jgi:hypothetical protein